MASGFWKVILEGHFDNVDAALVETLGGFSIVVVDGEACWR